MADFFKGLTGGFQSGLQLGEAMRAKQERERLQEAMQMAPQEVNQPVYQRAQAETQGLAAQDAAEFGLSPQEQAQYAPQAPSKQYGLGGQTFNRMPTQQEIESARYGAAANVIAERDPMAAMRMRQEQTRMTREEQEAPLRLQGLQQQVALGGEQLGAAKAATTARGRQEAFGQWYSQNPSADFNTVVKKTRELGMAPKEQFEAASSITGIDDAEFKASQSEIRKLTRNKSLDELLAAHKDSSLLDPNSHFEVVRGKGGQVSLNRVDSSTGKVIQPNVFAGNEAEAHKYLNLAASSPEAIIDYTMNLRKTKAQIGEAEAGIGLKGAQAGLVAAQTGLTGVHGQLYGAQLEGLKQTQANRDKVAALSEEFSNLTPAEQNGPAGRGLIKQINIANVKAGGQVSLGQPEKPARQISDAAVASLAEKMIGQPTGRLVDGKPEKYTVITAARDARAALSEQAAATVPAWGTTPPAAAPTVPAAAPAMQQGLYPGDEDWRNISARPLQQGSAVYNVPDARRLLATPSYSASPRSPDFRD